MPSCKRPQNYILLLFLGPFVFLYIKAGTKIESGCKILRVLIFWGIIVFFMG